MVYMVPFLFILFIDLLLLHLLLLHHLLRCHGLLLVLIRVELIRIGEFAIEGNIEYNRLPILLRERVLPHFLISDRIYNHRIHTVKILFYTDC